jgi:hypothetical protein
MAKRNKKHLRIFLSSPGDVAEEREIAARVIRELGQRDDFKDRVTLECVRWDDPDVALPMGSLNAAQDYVDQWIGTATDCDHTIVILWQRIGTEFTGKNGETFASGTVKEVYDALKSQTADPSLYFCMSKEFKDSEGDFRKSLRQWDAAYAFAMGEDGSPVKSRTQYENASKFENIFRADLERWLTAKLAAAGEDIWANYRAELIRDIEEEPLPLFDLGGDAPKVTLQSVYTPVHAYYFDPDHEPPPHEQRRWIGVDAYAEIQRWLKDDDATSIRFISGEPGRGKSSFAKTLAAGLAREANPNAVNVLLIPVRRLGRFVEDIVTRAMEALTPSDSNILETRPLPAGFDIREAPTARQVLFILDGLDELALPQSEAESYVYETFTELLEKDLKDLKRQNGAIQWRALVLGRAVAVGESGEDYAGTCLHVLPSPGQRLKMGNAGIGSFSRRLTDCQKSMMTGDCWLGRSTRRRLNWMVAATAGLKMTRIMN